MIDTQWDLSRVPYVDLHFIKSSGEKSGWCLRIFNKTLAHFWSYYNIHIRKSSQLNKYCWQIAGKLVETLPVSLWSSGRWLLCDVPCEWDAIYPVTSIGCHCGAAQSPADSVPFRDCLMESREWAQPTTAKIEQFINLLAVWKFRCNCLD